MAPDLIILGAICHEEARHIVRRPSSQLQSVIDSKTPEVSISECVLNSSSEPDTMTNSTDARSKSLVNMYSTSFVFNQNQKHLIKALPWSNNKDPIPNTVAHRPVPSSSEMQRMVMHLVQGRGNERKVAGDKQVQGLVSEKLRAEHAASMLTLLS